jgi:hypothetical protein
VKDHFLLDISFYFNDEEQFLYSASRYAKDIGIEYSIIACDIDEGYAHISFHGCSMESVRQQLCILEYSRMFYDANGRVWMSFYNPALPPDYERMQVTYEIADDEIDPDLHEKIDDATWIASLSTRIHLIDNARYVQDWRNLMDGELA